MMDERIKESISSLLDDEADELALRRVLGHAEQDEVKALWGRYSKVSSMLSSGGYPQGTLSGDSIEVSEHTSTLSIDVSQQVAEAIDAETIDMAVSENSELKSTAFGGGSEPSDSWAEKLKTGFSSRVAIAAAVVLALSFTINDFSSDQDPWVATSQPSVPVTSFEDKGQLQVAEKTFTPEHARRLNEYLLRHAENSLSGGRSGVMPLARVASFTITEN